MNTETLKSAPRLTSGIPQHTAQVGVALYDQFFLHFFCRKTPYMPMKYFLLVNLFIVLLFKYLYKNGNYRFLVEQNCCSEVALCGANSGQLLPLVTMTGS